MSSYKLFNKNLKCKIVNNLFSNFESMTEGGKCRQSSGQDGWPEKCAGFTQDLKDLKKTNKMARCRCAIFWQVVTVSKAISCQFCLKIRSRK